MKIFIVCSRKFYSEVEKVKDELKSLGHEIYMPNCYDDPLIVEKMKKLGKKEHQLFKAKMFQQSEETIKNMDAILVLNFDKEKDSTIHKNYIGEATFLEMYNAFRNNKKIFLYNDIPQGMLFDEIEAFAPIVINGDLSKIK